MMNLRIMIKNEYLLNTVTVKPGPINSHLRARTISKRIFMVPVVVQAVQAVHAAPAMLTGQMVAGIIWLVCSIPLLAA